MDKEILKKIIEENSETNKELFNLYFANLISSSTCIDINSCEDSLKDLNLLKKNLEELELESDLKKIYLNKVNIGIKIVKKDLEMYKNGGGFGC